MHHPIASVEVNGREVAGAFWSRLIRLTITDKAGSEADGMSIELLDGNPFLEIPKTGAKIRAWLGYQETGTRYMGTFVVDSVELSCLPFGMTISGKSADVRATLKEQKTRHFDGKTVKEVVETIAADHGLEPVVSDKVAGLKYDWLGQLDESDMHLLTRMAERHGAMVTFKDGKLIFAERSAGLSGSGRSLATLVLHRSDIIVGTCRVRFADRGKHKRVVAKWQDKGKQQRKEVEIESDAEASASYSLPETYASEDEALKAAQAKSREQQADSDTLELSVLGNPDLKAGQPLRLSDVRPGIDDLIWTVDTATHEFSKSGYTTRVSAKRGVESGQSKKKLAKSGEAEVQFPYDPDLSPD
ncbi:phage late control D family protein [Pseudochelatococcus sp. G4_1912]|uniref:phage late control D family protein n=1 Tax=Pseudochelatococcus sp. G4_1912 TaxID=3114288 RepID=UPI0039C63488